MNCFVIGNGGWGTALGMVLAGNGHNVTIWGPFEEEIETIRSAGENTDAINLPRDANRRLGGGDLKVFAPYCDACCAAHQVEQYRYAVTI